MPGASANKSLPRESKVTGTVVLILYVYKSVGNVRGSRIVYLTSGVWDWIPGPGITYEYRLLGLP